MKTSEKIYRTSITPSIAIAILRKNDINRPLRDRRVTVLAEAMKRGEWLFNGDTIRIAQDGQLLDGQNRLSACVLSGVPLDTIMVTGLENRVFRTIDDGVRRSYGDSLFIAGEDNPVALGVATRNCYLYAKTGSPFRSTLELAPTKTEIANFIDDNPSIRDAVSTIAVSPFIKKYMGAGIGAFCLFTFRSVCVEAADIFFHELSNGVGLARNSPILVLRDRLMLNASSKAKVNRNYITALVFKSFKKFAEKSEVGSLRVRTEGRAEKDVLSLAGIKVACASWSKSAPIVIGEGK